MDKYPGLCIFLWGSNFHEQCSRWFRDLCCKENQSRFVQSLESTDPMSGVNCENIENVWETVKLTVQIWLKKSRICCSVVSSVMNSSKKLSKLNIYECTRYLPISVTMSTQIVQVRSLWIMLASSEENPTIRMIKMELENIMSRDEED